MNSQPIMIDNAKLEEVRQSLARLGEQSMANAHGKLHALKPLKSEIVALKRKRIANAKIAQALTQAGIPVSSDTLRRFLIECGFGKPKPRTAKRISGQMTRPGLSQPRTQSAAYVPSGFKTIKDEDL